MSVIRHEVRPHLDPALHSAGTVLRRNQITSSKVSDAANALPAHLRTVPAMPAQMYVSRPLRSHGVAARPANEVRAAARTIARVDPSIVVPAAADPAVLVTMGADLRVRLATLLDETAVSFTQLAVVRLATGCIELAPAENVEPGVLPTLKLDSQRRLRFTVGLTTRLCATPGTKLFVTCDPPTRKVMVVNLGTLADSLDHLLNAAHNDAPAHSLRPVVEVVS